MAPLRKTKTSRAGVDTERRQRRAVRVSKNKKETKKKLKEDIKTSDGILAEARRLEDAATREQEEAARKGAKAAEMRALAEALQKANEKKEQGQDYEIE